ncbi:MAG: M23 family metallopeptidase [Clostridia bacterium]|nr:M23 family metallopeptidase [Clostridia bacterium]
MQYSNNRKKNTKSFYVVTAFCLIAIALTSYIAVSKNKSADEKSQKKENPVISGEKDTYNNKDSENDEITAQPTETKADDVPYTEPEPPAKEEKTEEEKTYILPAKGTVIKQFSEDTLQYDKTFGDMRLHRAIDISCAENSQIVSAASGTVTNVSDSAEFNKIVTIDHGNGYTVEYCGLGTTAVKKGENVAAGDTIGTAKNPPCECLDECHIHIVCLKDGVPFDPLSLYSRSN